MFRASTIQPEELTLTDRPRPSNERKLVAYLFMKLGKPQPQLFSIKLSPVLGLEYTEAELDREFNDFPFSLGTRGPGTGRSPHTSHL